MMIRLYAKLLELWDSLYTRHDKAVKLTVAGLLLALCVLMAVHEFRELITR